MIGSPAAMSVVPGMSARTGPDASGGWAPEPTYAKPDISVRATTLYCELAEQHLPVLA